jgi:two-component system sensor histidine kinase HydH
MTGAAAGAFAWRPGRRLYSRTAAPDEAMPAWSGDRMRPSLGDWVRWGWLATTLALGAALLTTAWVGLDRARAAASTLDAGQGQILLEALRQSVRAEPALPDSARLDSLLGLHEDGGLRFLALYDPERHLVAAAGTPVAEVPVPPQEPPPRPGALERVGKRLRMMASVMPARPLGTGARPGDARATAPPPPPDGGRPRFRPPMLVMEFEPLAAERLVAEATRTFALSALVAAALLAAALLFWRLTVRQEATERRLEQQRRLGALGEMSAVLAHEIRNPLASLKGHAQLLAERLGADGPERLKADLVVKEAQRLEALTTDLLDFARSGPVERKAVDPGALVRSCADEVAAGAFAVRTDGAPGTFPLDERRVRQALSNVLHNARQASGQGTRPEVTASAEGGALVVTVRDFGPGIPAGDEKRIFSPFYTTRTTGTGLGLAVALRVAELHGGTVTAENHPGGGALFRLTFRGG